MSPEQLAARSRATGTENERRVLAVLAAAVAAGVRPGRDLADLTGLVQRDPERRGRALGGARLGEA